MIRAVDYSNYSIKQIIDQKKLLLLGIENKKETINKNNDIINNQEDFCEKFYYSLLRENQKLRDDISVINMHLTCLSNLYLINKELVHKIMNKRTQERWEARKLKRTIKVKCENKKRERL